MRKFLLIGFALVLTLSVWAQERVVSGKVSSQEDGSALPGVNVVLKGTTNGTVTDADGNYKLTVPANGGSLVFSFIGLQTSEVEIGQRSVIDVALGLDVQQLSEVVVTGQGIAREKRALGYAVTTVNSNQIAARPETDIARILNGKIPGVTITPTGGTSGSGTNINIRGFSTLTGSTQPLWVVDGVPFNSNTNAPSGFTTGGAAASTSRFNDLDPNSIESINVLRGLAATVLYGDQGRNGVILVTTKSGSNRKRDAEITFQQTLGITEIASLPKFQNSYGNGFQQLWGNFFSNWGPHFDEIDSVGHPYQFLGDPELRNSFPKYFFKRYAYEATPQIGGFFRRGLVSNTALNASGGSDKLSYNASVGYTNEEGFAPGNNLKRLNISTGFTAALTKKLTIQTSMQFANTDFETPPLNSASGGGGTDGGVPSLYGQFLYTPRSVDVLNWEFETPAARRSIYFRGGNDIANPLWIAKYYREASLTNRFFNASSISYDVNDNFSLLYRVGLDTYTEQQSREFNKGGVQGPNVILGSYQTRTIVNTIWNHDFIASYSKDLSENLSLVAKAGANARNDFLSRDGLYSEGQSVFGLLRHDNFQSSSNRSIAFGGEIFKRNFEQQRYGVYADVSLDYKKFLSLNLSGRNDWTSTFERGNNTIFYPAASASFILTEAISALKSSTINYLKIRGGLGSSGGYGFPYQTRTIVAQNLRGWMTTGGTVLGEQSIGNVLGNLTLRPELVQEFELGFEARLLNERLSIDFSVYNRSTRDLITEAPLDPSTGYTFSSFNLGRVNNKGIEFAITGSVIQSGDFKWDAIWNFTAVRPEVEALGLGLQEVVLSGFTDLGNFAIPGRPYNTIKGSAIAKDAAGNRIVGANGLYLLDPNIQELGNPNPKFNTVLINSFSYKGLTFSFQFDYRHGGRMSAATPSAVLGRGVVDPSEKTVNRDLTFLLPGVRQNGVDGSGNPIYVKNDIQITAADYGFNTQFFGYNEVAMFDATTIRLREISLGYQLPKSFMNKTPFKSAFIQLNGNNLWFNAVNVPKPVNYDTEVTSLGVGNSIGFDRLTGPSARRYGFVLRLTL